ncbi:MAG: FtsW/RodA/SpoVE family cell cycle protein [Minisyncoccia bacterium]
MNFWSFVKKFDWVLLVLALGILTLAMLTFNQSGPKGITTIEKEFIFILGGLVVMFLVSVVDYRIFKNNSAPSVALYVLACFLLVLALGFPAVRGSRAWVHIGFGFQPSEFAKLAILILLAKYFSQKHVEIYRFHHILASGLYVALPAGLVLLQPDLGSMMVFVCLWLAMLFFAGIKRKHLLAIVMVGLVLASFAWFFGLKPYQKDRIISFVNPYIDPRGIGYNAIQAQTTFGSGQIFGTFFTGKKMAVMVPEQYTDFTFSAFGQKFGFVGVIVLIGLLVALIIRIGSIATRSHNNFAKLFSLGLITLISVHAFLNAGMNLGILPITGIPFPFLSYGGSNLMTLMMGLGIVESIHLRG